MSYVSAFAVFFILWWLVLFAMLPFSLRTQEEDGDVTLGTEASAPRGAHVLRAMLRTTVVSLVILAGLYALSRAGYGIDDIPRFMPEFE
jgi:predicted secreted protein